MIDQMNLKDLIREEIVLIEDKNQDYKISKILKIYNQNEHPSLILNEIKDYLWFNDIKGSVE